MPEGRAGGEAPAGVHLRRRPLCHPARGGGGRPRPAGPGGRRRPPDLPADLVFLGRDFSLEYTAEEAQDLRFAGAGGSLLLKDASGRTLGVVTGIYLPRTKPP